MPAIPEGASREAREVLPGALIQDAERAWRRAAPTWAPSLESLRAQGVERVEVQGELVSVVVRNATYRARGLAAAWRPVVICALTERELPAVRRALAEGASRFIPEVSCQSQ